MPVCMGGRVHKTNGWKDCPLVVVFIIKTLFCILHYLYLFIYNIFIYTIITVLK